MPMGCQGRYRCGLTRVGGTLQKLRLGSDGLSTTLVRARVGASGNWGLLSHQTTVTQLALHKGPAMKPTRITEHTERRKKSSRFV